MIDFGLISLFAIQLGLVAVTYHFFLATKSENKRISELSIRMDEYELRLTAWNTRINTIEAAPKSLTARIIEIENDTRITKNEVEKLSEKQTSLSAKISANARWAKAREEQGPTSEEEPEQELIFPTPSAPEITIPKTFGKLPTRRVING